MHAGGDGDVITGDTVRVQHHDTSPHGRWNGVGSEGDGPLLAITIAKENLLQAQIEQYKDRKPEGSCHVCAV